MGDSGGGGGSGGGGCPLQDGDVKLRSQAYQAEAGRDNGIQSVFKNRDKLF